jgi:hypothetical protein
MNRRIFQESLIPELAPVKEIELRQLYETESDLQNEKKVAEIICSAFGCSLIKLPIKYGVDYMATVNHELDGWYEIKCRKNPSNTYSDFMISLGKWISGVQLSDHTKAPFYLVVSFTDRIVWHRYDKALM